LHWIYYKTHKQIKKPKIIINQTQKHRK
jgi:hypothetical protein